jgi:hypothetical protein
MARCAFKNARGADGLLKDDSGRVTSRKQSAYADGSLDSFLTKHLVLREKGYTFVLALLNR